MNAFDAVPYSFANETIDVINKKYAEMQHDSSLLLNAPNFQNIHKADVLHSLLVHIADYPDNINVDDIVRLATLSVSWVESLVNEASNG